MPTAKGTPNEPLARKVQLYNANTNLLVAETWSDTQGLYRFDQIDSDQHYNVMSHDYTGHYRSVIANDLKPEVTV
jgi:hypothetical protein